MKKKQPRKVKRANNVFLDLGFPPHEAAVMLLRCELPKRSVSGWDREGIPRWKRQAPCVSSLASPRSRANKVESCLWTTSSACGAKAGVSVAREIGPP